MTPRSLAMAAMAVGLAGCAGGPQTVRLDASAALQGNTLRIEGATDLPDGSLLRYELRHERLAFDPETPEHMLYADGTMVVSGGRFDADVSVATFDSGRINVIVAFQVTQAGPLEQPDGVGRRYGRDGRNLVGENVKTLDSGEKRVEAIVTVDR